MGLTHGPTCRGTHLKFWSALISREKLEMTTIGQDGGHGYWKLKSALGRPGQTQGGRARSLAQNFCAVQSSGTLAGPARPAGPAVWHTAAQWNMILNFLNITHILHRTNFNNKHIKFDHWISQTLIFCRNNLSYWKKVWIFFQGFLLFLFVCLYGHP